MATGPNRSREPNRSGPRDGRRCGGPVGSLTLLLAVLLSAVLVLLAMAVWIPNRAIAQSSNAANGEPMAWPQWRPSVPTPGTQVLEAQLSGRGERRAAREMLRLADIDLASGRQDAAYERLEQIIEGISK